MGRRKPHINYSAALSSFFQYFKYAFKKHNIEELEVSELDVIKFCDAAETIPRHDYSLMVDTFFTIGYEDESFANFVSKFKTLKNFIAYKRIHHMPKYLREEVCQTD